MNLTVQELIDELSRHPKGNKVVLRTKCRGIGLHLNRTVDAENIVAVVHNAHEFPRVADDESKRAVVLIVAEQNG